MRASPDAVKTKTYVLLFLMLVLSPLGNVILDKGMKQIGSLELSSAAAVWTGFRHVVGSPTIWLGMACLAAYLVCYMLVLSWADLSFVMPISGMAFVLVPLLGYLWLHEQVPPRRWAGIALILLGVFLISRTPAQTTLPAPDAAHGETK